MLNLRHPSTVKDILKSAEPKPSGIGVYRFGKPWLGDGLLISKGQKWARHRRLLTTAFHFDILKPYTKVNNQAVEILLNKMSAYAKSGESFEIEGHIGLCTLDVILRCAFSYENDCQEKGDEHPYVQAVGNLGDLWVRRSLSPWVYSDFLYNLTSNGRKFRKHCDFVHSVRDEIVAKRKQTLKEKGASAMKQGRYLDFLDILLTAQDEDGTGLTHQEIADECDTFLFEGHDTTSSSLSWTLYSLAGHPEFQQKCRDEIDGIVEENGREDIDWEDLPKLKYLTMCIKEGMRLHCPVPFIERETTKEMEIDGKKLPPGTILDIQIYNLHHNPTIWDDAMEYQPDRFLPENIEKKDSYAFIPFSAGPRNCIGQNFAMHEQKVILARILRRFVLTLDPDHKVEKKISVVMKSQDGIKIKIQERNLS